MTQLAHQPVVLELSRGQALASRLHDYAEMTKLRITLMVVITAYVGFALAGGGDAVTLLATLLGTALSCMGASALNQVYERDTDALMRRTRTRPMPTGRVGVGEGVGLGVGLAAGGVALLAVLTTPLAALLAAATVVLYVLVYTPLKRVTTLNTLVGAAPGAAPPLIGCAAASGAIDLPALVVFAIMFVWQLPHFLAIAWLYRDQYADAGLRMLPAVEPDGRSTFRQVLAGCLALLPLGLLPTAIGASGGVYFAVALLAGLGFGACGVWLVVRRGRTQARLLFFASLVYLPAVLTVMMIDR